MRASARRELTLGFGFQFFLSARIMVYYRIYPRYNTTSGICRLCLVYFFPSCILHLAEMQVVSSQSASQREICIVQFRFLLQNSNTLASLICFVFLLHAMPRGIHIWEPFFCFGDTSDACIAWTSYLPTGIYHSCRWYIAVQQMNWQRYRSLFFLG